MVEFELDTIIDAPVEKVFTAWLSSEEHSAMTGGEALISNEVGKSFSARDDYITGQNIEIVDNERIVQSWRTAEFTNEEADSRLELNFTDLDGKTKIHLKHTKLPAHGEQYYEGWKNHYFIPMTQYFSNR